MRVVHIIDHLGAGGAQRLVADLAPRQKQRGHIVTVVCLRHPTQTGRVLETAGVRVHYLRLGRTDPRQAIDLRALLHAESPDIVHTHLTLSCLLGRIAAVMAGVEAVVVHDHEADAEIFITPAPLLALKRLLEPHLPPRGVRYIVISHSALSYACEVRRLPESNLILVPNGVDIAYLERGRVSSKAARAQFGLPVDAPLIGYAGRMAPEKGIDLLLEALSQLSGVHAAIAGQGPLANEMQAYARKLGVAERTHFLGHLDDIRPLLWACDVYVQPSRREAFGLAAAEASALGLPVVASRIGGLRDVVLDKVTGRLFQPGNVNELASILAFLVENVEYARILGFAGRSHIFQYFTIDAVLDRIDEIYWGILG
ncbi:MAG: glycosyltransferase [Roseiflexus sp.]|jgi:glycosyltransferase involved in cell wall biosynthesis|nr:glycosyltransferase [Roseiflexus sp.]